MVKYNYNEILSLPNLQDIINSNTTFAGIMRDLGLPTRGKLGVTLKKKLIDNGFDLSCLTGIPKQIHNKKSLEEHLCKGSTTQSSKLKLILFNNGLKCNKCECCGLESWQGKPIVMQLHHTDGDPTNNTIENLQILCPNCHSQTDGYCNSHKNKNK
jgi:Zn finger protein HypA/HybF involved in hydrogenase expression